MIKFKNVSKRYGEIVALDRASFEIQPEEFVTIVGESGAGKSTIVRLLTTEEKPTSGVVTINNRNIHELKRRHLPYFRRQIGVVYQDFKLLESKTVFENVAFAMETSEKSDEEIEREVPKILELVDIADKANNFPRELSGGEKQRVAIARALVFKPRLLIADEPTGNLDDRNSQEIINLLLKINRLGTTVILVTHERSIVDRIRRRVIKMVKPGRIVKDSRKGKYT